MTEVAVKGNLDGALKRFKQKCSRDGIPSEVKKRKFYDKPGKRRREEKKGIERVYPRLRHLECAVASGFV